MFNSTLLIKYFSMPEINYNNSNHSNKLSRTPLKVVSDLAQGLLAGSLLKASTVLRKN